MFGLGRYTQNLFYIEDSIYNHVLFLWIKGCRLFRNCMNNVTNNKSFGSGLTGINEVRKRIDYILDNIFFFLQISYLRIEDFKGYENMTC